MTPEAGAGRNPLPRPEMAPRRYNQLAALVVTDRVAREFESDTPDDKFRSAFIDAITPAIERGYVQVEPVERKRAAALSHIGQNLKARRLTALEYQTAGATLAQLARTDEVLGTLDLSAAQNYINDCAEDAEYYEKHVASKEIEQTTTQTVPVQVRDRGDERRGRVARRGYRRELAGINARLLAVNAVAAASAIGLFGGIAGDIYASNQQSGLPGYASSDTRNTVVRDLDAAIKDLTSNGSSTPHTDNALGSLRDADKNLKGAGTVITRPIQTVEGDISQTPPTGGDVFLPERRVLHRELGAVRGLGNSPAAKKYRLDDTISNVSEWAIVGSLIVGGADEGSAEPLRRQKRKLREKIRNTY